MNIHQIKYFALVCKTCSFAKAAESLFITQQGLNLAIINLENELNTKLFHRSPSGLSLTNDGIVFKGFADEIIKSLDNIESYFNTNDDEAENSELYLSCCHDVLAQFVAALIMDFEEKYPQVRVRVHECPDKAVDSEVLEGQAELGFSSEPFDSKSFDRRWIFTSPMVLLMHRDNPLAKFEAVTAPQCAEQPLITLDNYFKSSDFFIRECARQGVKILPRFRVGDTLTIHHLVSQNVGVGLTHLSAAKLLNTQDTVFRRFESDKFCWNVDIIKKKNYTLSTNARIFYHFLSARLPDLAMPPAGI